MRPMVLSALCMIAEATGTPALAQYQPYQAAPRYQAPPLYWPSPPAPQYRPPPVPSGNPPVPRAPVYEPGPYDNYNHGNGP